MFPVDDAFLKQIRVAQNQPDVVRVVLDFQNIELKPGDEVVITENNQPVARLIPTGARSTRRKLGSLRGTVKHMAPDFDAPLEDFKEYMEYME